MINFYYFTDKINNELLYIWGIDTNLYYDFVDTIEGEYPEISGFYTNAFSVYSTTEEDRFEVIKKGVVQMINKKYNEVSSN